MTAQATAGEEPQVVQVSGFEMALYILASGRGNEDVLEMLTRLAGAEQPVTAEVTVTGAVTSSGSAGT